MNKNRKEKLFRIVFRADTPAGKLFDIVLLVAISLSVVLVLLESVPFIFQKYGDSLHLGEWIITGLFTAEYIVRIAIVRNKQKYLFSFYGIIDLMSVLPVYLSLIFPPVYGLSVVRSIRLLRVFRILKLSRYLDESQLIVKALKASRRKIAVFLFAILMLVTILGSIMYIVESPESGFTSIPQGIYWAIVTLTTVGYGDIAPVTILGKIISSFVMILGYAIIAVPTGIVTSEFANLGENKKLQSRFCPSCSAEIPGSEDRFCRKCGKKIDTNEE